jgi:hypothetical protein
LALGRSKAVSAAVKEKSVEHFFSGKRRARYEEQQHQGRGPLQ